MQAERDDSLAGTPYRILSRIGGGGMGEVLLAEHVALGKRVAIKILHAHLSRDPAILDRLRLEAQALARLTMHENLVEVLDFGRAADGRPYLVLERLRGRTLAQELAARGPLPPLEAIDRIRQALAGLSAAHAAGIVHRDVKLENLFLCDPRPGEPRATVKVLDFGVAKLLETAAGLEPLAMPTEEGMVVGSPRTLAPEQARAGRIDERTDVYTTGLALYKLITGVGPFDHIRGFGPLVHALCTETPTPPSVMLARKNPATRHVIPVELDHAVLVALERDPEKRYRSADAFSQALAKVAEAIQLDDEADAAPTVMMPSVLHARAAAAAASRPHAASDPRATVRLPDAHVPALGAPPTTGPAPAALAPRSPAPEAPPPAAPAPSGEPASRGVDALVSVSARRTPSRSSSTEPTRVRRPPPRPAAGLRLIVAGTLALLVAIAAAVLAERALRTALGTADPVINQSAPAPA